MTRRQSKALVAYLLKQQARRVRVRQPATVQTVMRLMVGLRAASPSAKPASGATPNMQSAMRRMLGL